MRLFSILFALLVALGCTSAALAQSRRVPPRISNDRANESARPTPTPTPTPAAPELPDTDESPDVIAVDTRLVTIPVRVLDRKNRFIAGLLKENFSVFEDGVRQEIAYFTNESQPFTVALVLDMSYSATFKIEQIQSAALAFIAQLRPEDQVMVISFDQDVHMLCEATADRKRIYNAIMSTRIATGTSLYEAVDLTMNARMRSIQGRKAIVLFTDGVDTTSRRSNDAENLRDAMELDALIYTIRYDTYSDVQRMKNTIPVQLPGGIEVPGGLRIPTPGPRATPTPQRSPDIGNDPFPGSRPPPTSPGQRGTTAEEYAFAEEYLNKLALYTGGRSYLASSIGTLSDAFGRIASELREFYSLGYYPLEEGTPGRSRRIKVRVDQPNAAVRARDSYVVRKR
jgi:Ca-activated chloride channel homolog